MSPGGEVPNFGLILSILIKRGWELGAVDCDASEHTSWVYPVLEMAKEAGIQVAGAPRYERVLKDIEDNGDDMTPEERNKWDKTLMVRVSACCVLLSHPTTC